MVAIGSGSILFALTTKPLLVLKKSNYCPLNYVTFVPDDRGLSQMNTTMMKKPLRATFSSVDGERKIERAFSTDNSSTITTNNNEHWECKLMQISQIVKLKVVIISLNLSNQADGIAKVSVFSGFVLNIQTWTVVFVELHWMVIGHDFLFLFWARTWLERTR